MHALYGFTRYADEIVDRTDGMPPAERTRRLGLWRERFLAGLRGEPVDDPLLPAVLHTVVEGSAAVIGTLLLPILAPADAAAAHEPARQLGFAFQLTNFIRDVAEDLERGRIYLPQADLERFGVTASDLAQANARHRADSRVRRLIRYEVRRAQGHYTAAAPGIPMLPRSSQACVRAAYRMYGGILNEVARTGYDVFAGRAVVPNRRRLGMATRSLLTPAGTPVPVPAG